MKAAPEPEFKRCYDLHCKHLRLQGLRPKTIAAYARAFPTGRRMVRLPH
jgi:hypothetical protein